MGKSAQSTLFTAMKMTYVAICRRERKIYLAHSPGGSGPIELASAHLWGVQMTSWWQEYMEEGEFTIKEGGLSSSYRD